VTAFRKNLIDMGELELKHSKVFYILHCNLTLSWAGYFDYLLWAILTNSGLKFNPMSGRVVWLHVFSTGRSEANLQSLVANKLNSNTR